MFRILATAAILSLATAAQADDLNSRIHDAAVKACAARVGANLPISYYRPLAAHCVDRVSAMALASITAKQVARNEGN